jgi:acyl-coenzyme A thioesterase PaaI-like protein
MADHTAGAAASLLGLGEIVLTAEFKISLLRAARGRRLRRGAEVIRPGSRVRFAESTVYCESGVVAKRVARA